MRKMILFAAFFVAMMCAGTANMGAQTVKTSEKSNVCADKKDKAKCCKGDKKECKGACKEGEKVCKGDKPGHKNARICKCKGKVCKCGRKCGCPKKANLEKAPFAPQRK